MPEARAAQPRVPAKNKEYESLSGLQRHRRAAASHQPPLPLQVPREIGCGRCSRPIIEVKIRTSRREPAITIISVAVATP